MIPNWIEIKVSNELVTEVIRHMKTRHASRDHAAKKNVILAELFSVQPGDKQYQTVERVFRRCVELANQEHGGMIVSDTEAGYWWAVSLQDGIGPAEAAFERAKSIMENANTVMKNIKNSYGGQIGLL